MKKLISILLAAVMLAGVLSVSVSAADNATSGKTGDCKWIYNAAERTLTISGKGKTDDYSWQEGKTAPWCELPKKVVVEEGVTSLGSYLFAFCYYIEDVKLPSTLKTIGNCAFDSCQYLEEITIPDSVTSIGDTAFMLNKNLTKIKLPKSLKTIGSHAFDSCHFLKEIAIPDKTETIGEGAFKDSDRLEKVTIPSGIKRVGKDAFLNTPFYENLPDGVIYFGKALYGYKGFAPENLSVKAGTRTISDYAFSECANIQTLTIPSGVTSIGDYSFNECTGIKKLTMPNSITSVGEYAFNGCSALESVRFSKNLSAMGKSAFDNCESIKSLTLPKKLTEIPANAFRHCSLLTKLTIPEGVTSVGSEAFSYCNNVTALSLPETITELGYLAFSFEKMDKVYVPYSVKKLGTYAVGYYVTDRRYVYPYDKFAFKFTVLTLKGSSAEKFANECGFKVQYVKTSVKVNKSSVSIYRKGKKNVPVTVKYPKGNSSYKSSNTKITTVSKSGKITAKAKGTATITVKNNGITKKFKVNVKNPSLNKTTKNLKKGSTFTLKIKGQVGAATFKSGDTKVAKVSQKGKITAKKSGATNITVKTNGIKLKCKITVK